MTDWEKRARDLSVEYDGTEAEWVSLAVRLGREMADARAEEIMKRCKSECDEVQKQAGRRTDYAIGLAYASEIARSTVKKPKTREQALEEAVIQIRKLSVSDIQHDPGLIERITRRALECNPND